jgi:uncharacterized protein YfaS (alpha-2-macroglobulin family)
MATDYTVDVPAQTKAMNGKTLGKALHWTFSTPPVKLIQSFPSSQQEVLQPLLFAQFDQRVDEKALINNIELTSKNGGGKWPVRLAQAAEVETDDKVQRLSKQAPEGRWIAFRPVNALPAATPFTVKLRAGLSSAEGPRRTSTEQSFSFATHGRMKIERSECDYGGKCVPMSPFRIEFSNTIETKQNLAPLVEASPAIKGLKVEAHGSWLMIQGVTKGRTKYDIKVRGGIKDVHGQTMGQDASVAFQVGPAEPRLFGPEHEMVVLDPAAPKAYSVYSVNEPELRARLYQVAPEDWGSYVEYTRDWERPRKHKAPGRLLREQMLTPSKSPDELVSTSLDLSQGLEEGHGQRVLVVESTRRLGADERRQEHAVWIQATDLGVNAYVEADQITGWVTKLANGAPLAGVHFALLGASFQSAETDASGLAHVRFASGAGKFVYAKLGSDVALLPEAWYGDGPYKTREARDAVRWFVYDDRGIYKPGESAHVKGWIRRAGMGRGGDIDFVPDASGKSIAWKVYDPRRSPLGTGTTTVDAEGSFDFEVPIPKNANLGSAHIELSLDGVSLAGNSHYHAFQIEEFRTPEFEVSAKASEGPHVAGGHAVATVAGRYYAGGALPNAKVNWTVTSSEATFTPPNRSDYHFGRAPRMPWWSRGMHPNGTDEGKRETWTSQTNAQGEHRLRVDFDAISPAYPRSLEFQAQVEDVNRQQWAAQTLMLVHPATRTVGLHLPKGYVAAGEPLHVDFIVTDLDGKLVAGRAIRATAARVDWVQKGAEYTEAEVDSQTCEVSSKATTANDSVRCTFKPNDGGTWRITAVVEDEQGRKSQSTTDAYVTGGTPKRQANLEADKVTLITDKPSYRPNDVAEVLVVAPFAPAEGVLTLRRQGIVRIERFTMTSPSYVLKLKLDDALVPNAELHVDLVGSKFRQNGEGTQAVYLPQQPAFATGSTDLKIVPSTRTLTVSATARKTAVEPGASTNVDVAVKDANGKGVAGAQVALVVVDEAVLALTGYKTPDPISVFYSPRASDVRDLALRERVLLGDLDLPREGSQNARDKREGGTGYRGQPGLMMAPMAAASAAPPPSPFKMKRAEPKSDASPVTPMQVRANFNALALFAPHMTTDAQGRVSVLVKLPDNLTRYRVMATVAAGERNFGANESKLTARLPLMVRISAPRFLNFGDQFELPITVQNQTDTALDVGVVVRATNATVNGPAAKRVHVAPNDRVEVRFSTATQKPGTARFQVGIAAGAFQDASQVELPVYTPATTEAFATYGEVDDGAIAQPIALPKGVFPQFGGLSITTSSTQVQALTDAVLYLAKYPFECNEQIASRVLSIAALRDVLTAFHAEGLPEASALEASVKADLQTLKRHQNANGGWGFWQETPWPYLSVHVAHALARATAKGYEPDAGMMKETQTYLRNIQQHIPTWYGPDARRSLIAYSLFVRHQMGDADASRAKQVINEAGGVEKLPLEALGWIWPTLSADKSSTTENEKIRRHVANQVTETAGGAHFVTGYKDDNWLLLHSDRRADGILLDAMILDQKSNSLIPKLVKGLLGHRTQGRWENTNESAFVLLALDRYFATFEKVTPDFIARAWLGDQLVGQQTFKGRSTSFHEINAPMPWLLGTVKTPLANVTLSKEGPGRLYYRIGMKYAPTDLKLPPLDRGFVVSRTYEGAERPGDVKHNPDGTWSVKAGSKVRVRVSMVAPSRRYHVALVDPIPAGFEPLNAALNVTGEIPKDPKDSESRAKTSPYWFWARTWYEHQNMRDERVEAFASLLYAGVWDYTYVTKATTPGSYVVPPPKAEEMYSPETFGRGASDRVVVE